MKSTASDIPVKPDSTSTPSATPSHPTSDWRSLPYVRKSLALLLWCIVSTALTMRTGWGLNAVLIAATAIGCALSQRGRSLRHPVIRLQLLAWAGVAVAFVCHLDSFTGVGFWLVTFLLLAAIAFAPDGDPLRSLSLAAVRLGYVPKSCLRALQGFTKLGQLRSLPRSPSLTNVILPASAILVFGALYGLSNSVIAAGLERFGLHLASLEVGTTLFHFALQMLLWLVPGAALLYSAPLRGVLRKPFGKTHPAPPKSIAAWSPASVTLVLVNLMALALNTADITLTWFAIPSESGAELKHGVHVGTSALIAAIVLASAFSVAYLGKPTPDTRRSTALAVGWLAQNGLMAVTVAIRNFHYGDAYGLTYKRLGVYLFLLCAVGGLVLLARKILYNTSLDLLVRRQAWVVYAVLVLAVLPAWPSLFTRYNLSAARFQHDYEYLTQLLPDNLSTWYELDPTLATVPDKWWPYEAWTRAPVDWRGWDLATARRHELKPKLEAAARRLHPERFDR